MDARKTNILVVEDDEVNQFVTKKILSKWGMEVTIASDGREAVSQITSKVFQLVLMDIQMPVMDGLAATRAIRAMDDWYFKTIPILAFTASGMIQKANDYGLTDVITKPLVVDDLRTKIEKYTRVQPRPLGIDFSLYTDGDLEFQNELISLLVENLKELQQSLTDKSQITLKRFCDVLHKVSTTVAMLCDRELTQLLDEIESLSHAGQTGEMFEAKRCHFNQVCDQVINSLNANRQFSPKGN